METNLLIRLSVSAAVILVGIILRMILKRSAMKVLHKSTEGKRRLISRFITYSTWGIVLFALIAVWGGSLETIWVSITGILGLIAIGFFAVWSILSNIVAGAIILLVRQLEIGDSIIIVGDEVEGTVKDVTAFFVELENKGEIILVPNNVFLQKIVRKQTPQKTVKKKKIQNKPYAPAR